MAAYHGRRIRSAGLRMFSRSCSGRIVGYSKLWLAAAWIPQKWVSRRFSCRRPTHDADGELGHESLATTQRYLADVHKAGEAKKAVADPDFVPKPKVVKTGTGGA